MDARTMTDPVKTVTSFTFQDGPEPWIFFLLILPGVIFLSVFLYRKEKAELSLGIRSLLISLRCLLLILLFLFLFRPVLLTSRVIVEKPAAVLLVDDSASMREHDSYTEVGADALATAAGVATGESVAALSRRELVRRVLDNPQSSILETLRDRYDLKAYGFGSGLVPIGGLEDLNAKGESTRLGDALAGTVRDYRGSGLAAIVLVSDGRSNRGRAPRDAAFLALNQQVPVHTVGVGDPSEPRNVEVTGVNAPTVALVGDEITFKVNVFSSGFGGRPVALLLKGPDGRAVFSTRDFALKESGGEQQEHLYWRPEQEGDYTLTVEVPLLPGEQDEKDNSLTHVVRVESARIRVLYVEGYPRWEYRFLKNLLLRAENFEVQVFLQSADPDFIQESSGAMPSLKALPQDRKSLMEYHVILFGDVDPAALGATWEESREILNNIKYFVEAGGGFLMQAGELHSPASYAETAIADILPVVIGNYEGELLAAGGSGAGDESSFFRPKLENFLTPHEILLLEKDPARNRRLWEDPEYGLPGFLWYYPVERAKPGAEVLARHPRAGNRHGNHVVMATTFFPSGRTLFLGVDSTWRWRSPYGDRYMEKFWRGAVRHLAQNKLRRKDYRYELYTDRSLYDLNERIQITARVLDSDYRLSRKPMQEAKLMGPDGAVEDLTLNQARSGEYGRSIVRSEPGVYQLWIAGEGGDTGTRHALTSFSVTVPRLESENPILDAQLLTDVARTTGGRYLDLHEAKSLLTLLDDEQRTRRLSDPERRDLWSSWWALLLFVGIFAAEWIIRKWYNLL